MFIPVISKDGKPLMPTTPSRARRWIRDRKATPFWSKGIFCVRLNVEQSNNFLEPVVVGIDPGSKKEAFTIKSESHTFRSCVEGVEKTHQEQLQGVGFSCAKNRCADEDCKEGGQMNRNIERYLPFPLLMWRAITQPFWDGLAWLVDLLIRVKLRQLDVKK